MSLLQFVNSTGEVLERGDVVVIAPRQPDLQASPERIPSVEVDVSESVYDTAVCGIVHDLYVEHKPESASEPAAEKPQGRGGRKRTQAASSPTQAYTLEQLETLDRSQIAPGQVGYFVASGICTVCKVDADIAPIKAGDLLTTSATKGHAQKVTDISKSVGAVLGKALAALKKGKGVIPVLVTIE